MTPESALCITSLVYAFDEQKVLACEHHASVDLVFQSLIFCLVCFAAEEWRNEGNHTGIRVWLTEADPSSFDLQEYVREALRNKGFGPVEVRTEW